MAKSIRIPLAGLALTTLALAAVAQSSNAQAAQTRDYHIESQPLPAAVNDWADQAGLQVMWSAKMPGAQREAPEVAGRFSAPVALERVLQGSGLTFAFLDEQTVAIRLASAATQSSFSPGASGGETHSASPAQAENRGEESKQSVREADSAAASKAETISEVIVTGTHIRGAQPVGSALKVYSRDDIAQSGAASVDQFARQITENFSGADAVSNSMSNAINGRFGQGAGDNSYAGASFNLHGLGSTSTLTLLNGHRLAPAGLNGLLTDISMLPLSAVERIEVLSDGASAIYGADAVAGVVNIVTRKDFSGAETSLRYGAATGGGDDQYSGSQLLGTSWNSGNALLTYEYNQMDGLDASKRDYIPSQGGPYSLIPENRRNSVLLTGSQAVGSTITISGDALVSQRDTQRNQTIDSSGLDFSGTVDGKVEQSGLTLGLEGSMGPEWHASLTGNYSRVKQHLDVNSNYSGGFTFVSDAIFETDTKYSGVDALLDRSLFSMPGGSSKLALGAHFHKEWFAPTLLQIVSGNTTNYSAPSLERDVTSGFAELLLPVVGGGNSFSGAKRLELSLAARYDKYNDFGSTTNPKFGILWEPIEGVSLRGSYGKSFRAPPLSQIGAIVYPGTFLLPDPNSPGTQINTLVVSGGNADLGPERSKSFSTGFDFKPAGLPNFVLSATYFSIRYSGRIASPTTSLTTLNFNDPVQIPFITVNPPLSVVQAYFDSPTFFNSTGLGPEAVQAIFNNQLQNIALTKQSGIDFYTQYVKPTEYGDFTWSLNGTHLLKSDFQTTTATPEVSLLDTFAQPTTWKLRGGLGFAQGGFSSTLRGNFVSSYQNDPLTPRQRIASWTTIDLFLSYKTDQSAQSDLLSNCTVSLSVLNLADKDPPYVVVDSILSAGQNPIPFDPTNASPVGRFISLGLTKQW